MDEFLESAFKRAELANAASTVRRAQHEPAAFAELYRVYLPSVYAYLFARIGIASEAEELTAQVFLDVLEGLPRYQERGLFAAWLFAIARRRVVDYFRRRPDIPLDQAMQVPAAEAGPLAVVLAQEDRRRLQKLVAALSDNDQELLRLRFAAGLSFPAMAGLLRRSEPAVKMAFYRLLDRLAYQMEVEHDPHA